MRVDHTRKGDRLLLPPRGFPQEVIVAGKEDAARLARAVQESRIFLLGGAVFEGRQQVHTLRRSSTVMARGTWWSM